MKAKMKAKTMIIYSVLVMVLGALMVSAYMMGRWDADATQNARSQEYKEQSMVTNGAMLDPVEIIEIRGQMQAEINGLITWLELAEANPSMYVYETWIKELQKRFTGLALGYGRLEEAGVIMDSYDRFLQAEGLILGGIKSGNKEMILKGKEICKDISF